MGELPGPDADPLAVLRTWLDDVAATGVQNPTAMTVATTGVDGVPDARVVLCRGVDDRGLVFYTDRRSAKGAQLAATPVAAAVFHWHGLQRQVRVRGPVEVVDDDASGAYWAGRPRRSQVSAWASHQSATVDDRAALEAAWAATEERFADVTAIPRPPDWGGYRLVAEQVEFWVGHRDRLHDRRRFARGDGGWSAVRLQP